MARQLLIAWRFLPLVLLHFLPFGFSTRFLPMVVWDHLNPQLFCRCNWLVVPHTDLYDVLKFVCPTLKIAVTQIDGYSRPASEMNENIFRRRWRGSEKDFKSSIRNESIHSFCNVSNSESFKIHSCNNGKYGSVPVTLKDHNHDKKKHYEKNSIYVFFNNGEDGQQSTLQSTKVSCSMLFAVYVSDEENVKYDMTFGKKALTEECKCTQPYHCPTETITTTTASTTSTLTLLERTLSVQPTVTTSQALSTHYLPTKYSTTTIYKPRSPDVHPETQHQHCWLTTGLLIILIIAMFVSGIMCTLLFIAVRKKAKKKYARCASKTYAQCSEDKHNRRLEIEDTRL